MLPVRGCSSLTGMLSPKTHHSGDASAGSSETRPGGDAVPPGRARKVEPVAAGFGSPLPAQGRRTQRPSGAAPGSPSGGSSTAGVRRWRGGGNRSCGGNREQTARPAGRARAPIDRRALSESNLHGENVCRYTERSHRGGLAGGRLRARAPAAAVFAAAARKSEPRPRSRLRPSHSTGACAPCPWIARNMHIPAPPVRIMNG